MERTKRGLVVAILCTLVVAVAGCGVSSGDEATKASDATTTTVDRPSTTADPGSSEDDPTTTPKDLTPAEQQAVDTITQTYKDLGLNDADAKCLAEGLVGKMGAGGSTMDTNAIMDAVNECDISMDELSNMGPGPGASMEDGVKFGLEASLKNSGLSDDQATCVADAFVDAYGADFSAAQDQSKLRPLLEQCNVDPSDFKAGN